MNIMVRANEMPVDVICQHTRDQNIIPIKIRLKDEDQAFQEYKIREYKCINPGKGSYQLPNEIYVNSNRWSFECKIEVFGTIKKIKLYYESNKNLWTVEKKYKI